MRFAALATSCLGLSAPLHAYVLKRDITPHPEDAQEGDVTVDEEMQSAAYLEALSLSETDQGDDDIGAASIRLVGFDGCTDPRYVGTVTNAAAQIYSGWQQAQKIMRVQSLVDGNVDFNTAGALEYLGASGLNNRQSDMNVIFSNFATLTPAWWPFGWRLHVRCDDVMTLCSCGESKRAYTTTRDAESGLARINFCPEYWGKPTLNGEINTGKTLPDAQKYDMDRYWNTQGHIWAHELMHIDWVTGAQDPAGRWRYGTNAHVTDMKITFTDTTGRVRTVRAYEPTQAKILARWPLNTGDYTIHNADNLALFMTSQYVQQELGNNYPNFPLVNVPGPNRAPFDSPFILNDDGSVTFNETHPDAAAILAAEDTGSCALDAEDPDPIAAEFTSFATDDQYPSEYIDQLNTWVEQAGGGVDPGEPVDEPADDNGSLEPVYLDNELGLVTCYKPHDAGDETYYFTLDTGNQAIADFCSSTASGGVSPGLVESIQANTIDVKAARDDNDEGCPPLDVTADDFIDTCTERLSVALNGCDTTNPGAADSPWKQGGTFYRDCVSWSLKLGSRPQ